MKGTTDIIMSLHHLNMAQQHLESFIREKPAIVLSKVFSVYEKKIRWIVNDLQTNPVFTENVRKAVKKEMEADSYSVPAIAEKIALLNPELRDAIESVLDKVIAGEELQITI